MCGIVGYTGNRKALPILIDALKRLEYRGYDSLGIAITHNKKLNIYKEVGEISKLEKKIPHFNGRAGIAHTRWATHGKVTPINAHPHLSCNKKIAIVHNGIINNFQQLKDLLIKQDHTFTSETDSEIIAHLIESYYEDSLENAVVKASQQIDGSYAFAATSSDEPNTIVAARKESPLVIGIGEGENFIASDIPALLRYTDKVIFLNDGEIATVTNNSIQIIDHQGNVMEKEVKKVEWNLEDAQKGGFSHFMLKEIYEQPDTIHKTFLGRVSEIEPSINFGDIGLSEEELSSIRHITILACGTSYYAGMVGKYIIEKVCSIPVDVEISSEYISLLNTKNDTLFIAITQSGETADTLVAIRKVKVVGCKTLAITNVPDSTITRLTHGTIYTRAGPEIGVAATKTFTSQLVVLYLFALHMGLIKGITGPDKAREFIQTIKHLPRLVQSVIDDSENIMHCTRYLDNALSVFFVGRNINYPVSLEGALKLKEISYVHAEGFAAGELKHGPFALLTKHTPVFAILVKDEFYSKMLGNIGEIKARYAPVIAIADHDDEDIKKYVDEVLRIPSISPEFSPILISVIYQLLAYHNANKKGYSIDKPRNLAKSVTVE